MSEIVRTANRRGQRQQKTKEIESGNDAIPWTPEMVFQDEPQQEAGNTPQEKSTTRYAPF